MKINLDDIVFRSISNTENGEVDSETLFHYQQDNDIVSANYHGGQIAKGHLLWKQLESGHLEFVYHHVNKGGQLMFGKCLSTPALTADGKIKFSEEWQWMSGDKTIGKSEIEEV